MTEYLYDRDNPKSHFRQRISGIQGLMHGVPNINERADMIGRYVKYLYSNLIEPSLRRLMAISTNSWSPLESPVIWLRSGEHSRTSLDSSRTPLGMFTGRCTPCTPRTESASSGSSSSSTSTSPSSSGS